MTSAKSKSIKGIIFVVLASMCYGITPILSNTALKGGLPADFLARFPGFPRVMLLDPANAMPNESVVGFGMAIACVLSLLACLVRGGSLKVSGRQALELSLFGGGGFTATMLLISYAYLSIPAGMTIVLNFTYPLIVAVISALFFKDKLRPLGLLALALAIAGVALISGAAGSGGAALGTDPALGIPLALLSGLAYAVYFLAGRHASYRDLETSCANVYITGSAALICFAVAIAARRFRLPPNWFIWLVLLSSGILGYMVGLRLLLMGIRLLGSVTASALNTLEPVFASVTSMLVFGELMTPVKAAGAGLVLIGALLSILAMKRRE
ncbi:MAG: DMT family transporter [Clostridia bacterium]|nr:DMT family transporter [Clostridia bacterium]